MEGQAACSVAAQALLEHLAEAPQPGAPLPSTSEYEAAFAACHQQLLQRSAAAGDGFNASSSGASALAVSLTDAHISVASAGLCQAVLARWGPGHSLHALQLAGDARLCAPSERCRLESSAPGVRVEPADMHTPGGGGVDSWRLVVEGGGVVSGVAAARMLGCPAAEQYGVVPQPLCTLWRASEADAFLLLGSPGLWQAMSAQEAVEFVGAYMAAGLRQRCGLAPADALTLEAQARLQALAGGALVPCVTAVMLPLAGLAGAHATAGVATAASKAALRSPVLRPGARSQEEAVLTAARWQQQPAAGPAAAPAGPPFHELLVRLRRHPWAVAPAVGAQTSWGRTLQRQSSESTSGSTSASFALTKRQSCELDGLPFPHQGSEDGSDCSQAHVVVHKVYLSGPNEMETLLYGSAAASQADTTVARHLPSALPVPPTRGLRRLPSSSSQHSSMHGAAVTSISAPEETRAPGSLAAADRALHDAAAAQRPGGGAGLASSAPVTMCVPKARSYQALSALMAASSGSGGGGGAAGWLSAAAGHEEGWPCRRVNSGLLPSAFAVQMRGSCDLPGATLTSLPSVGDSLGFSEDRQAGATASGSQASGMSGDPPPSPGQHSSWAAIPGLAEADMEAEQRDNELQAAGPLAKLRAFSGKLLHSSVLGTSSEPSSPHSASAVLIPHSAPLSPFSSVWAQRDVLGGEAGPSAGDPGAGDLGTLLHMDSIGRASSDHSGYKSARAALHQSLDSGTSAHGGSANGGSAHGGSTHGGSAHGGSCARLVEMASALEDQQHAWKRRPEPAVHGGQRKGLYRPRSLPQMSYMEQAASFGRLSSSEGHCGVECASQQLGRAQSMASSLHGVMSLDLLAVPSPQLAGHEAESVPEGGGLHLGGSNANGEDLERTQRPRCHRSVRRGASFPQPMTRAQSASYAEHGAPAPLDAACDSAALAARLNGCSVLASVGQEFEGRVRAGRSRSGVLSRDSSYASLFSSSSLPRESSAGSLQAEWQPPPTAQLGMLLSTSAPAAHLLANSASSSLISVTSPGGCTRLQRCGSGSGIGRAEWRGAFGTDPAGMLPPASWPCALQPHWAACQPGRLNVRPHSWADMAAAGLADSLCGAASDEQMAQSASLPSGFAGLCGAPSRVVHVHFDSPAQLPAAELCSSQQASPKLQQQGPQLSLGLPALPRAAGHMTQLPVLPEADPCGGSPSFAGSPRRRTSFEFSSHSGSHDMPSMETLAGERGCRSGSPASRTSDPDASPLSSDQCTPPASPPKSLARLSFAFDSPRAPGDCTPCLGTSPCRWGSSAASTAPAVRTSRLQHESSSSRLGQPGSPGMDSLLRAASVGHESLDSEGRVHGSMLGALLQLDASAGSPAGAHGASSGGAASAQCDSLRGGSASTVSSDVSFVGWETRGMAGATAAGAATDGAAQEQRA